jgi:predicted DNA-binding mobile mystery protein A
MAVRDIARRQYQRIVDRAASSAAQRLNMPSEGWIATARKALGMSAAQVGRKLNLTRARVSQAERAELSGGVTIKTMEAMAKALGCRFVYAIVPGEGTVEDLILRQAEHKAKAVVEKASVHMALERQSLPDEKNQAEVKRLADELARTMPSDFWSKT